MITQEYLKARFGYDEDGWLFRYSTGSRLGCVKEKYIKVVIHGETYYAHRLIFLWHFGYMPDYIDHIDRNGFNNRIENLRVCTPSENQGNSNRGPLRGIEKHGRKYRVRIGTNEGKIELGSYDLLDDAIIARDKGYRAYYGEFYV